MFIIGTGPSLREEIGREINALKSELTFGVNLLAHCITGEDGFMDFVPTYYGAGEIDWLRNIDAVTAGFSSKKILSCFWAPATGYVKRPDDWGDPLSAGLWIYNPADDQTFDEWSWVWRPENRAMGEGWFNGFGSEFTWAADGGSVVFDCAVQLAAWMGCDPVYLLGCETTIYGHAYGEGYEPPERIKERQEMVLKSAEVAKKHFELNNRKLIDLSGPTGRLPLVRADFADVLRVRV